MSMQRFVNLTFLGLMLGLLLVLGVALVGCGDDNDSTWRIRAPAVLTVVVDDQGVALISAHPSLSIKASLGYGTARVWREDAPVSHSAFIDGTATLIDKLCPGSYRYYLEDDVTGDILDALVSFPVDQASPAALGCVVEEKKVALCHNGHTILVSEHAVNAHVAHGDTLGECVAPPPPPPPPVEPCVDEGWQILDPVDVEGERHWVALPPNNS